MSIRDELPWMVYGAYGVTGRLIVEEALRRGHRPMLAGRDAARLQAMAKELGLESIAASLSDAVGLRRCLKSARLVVHAVGPFSETGRPMLEACLQTQTPYVDIAGEIAHLRAVAALNKAAQDEKIPLLAGAGFGTTYGDCLARHVVDRLPDATHLQISVAANNAHASPASRRTVLAVLAGGGGAIEDGRWVRRPLAHRTWTVSHQGRVLPFAAAPMGELIAAAASTGVANIVVGRPMPRKIAAGLRLLTPLLRAAFGFPALRLAIERRPSAKASDRAQPAAGDRISHVWAEARNVRGDRAAAYLECGEGYAATAAAVVANVEALLSRRLVGAFTPASAFGADHVLTIPGVTLVDLDVPAVHGAESVPRSAGVSARTLPPVAVD